MLSAQNLHSPQLLPASLGLEQADNAIAQHEGTAEEFGQILNEMTAQEVVPETSVRPKNAQLQLLLRSADGKRPAAEKSVLPGQEQVLALPFAEDHQAALASTAPVNDVSVETAGTAQAEKDGPTSNLAAKTAPALAVEQNGQALAAAILAAAQGPGNSPRVNEAKIFKQWQDPFQGLEGEIFLPASDDGALELAAAEKSLAPLTEETPHSKSSGLAKTNLAHDLASVLGQSKNKVGVAELPHDVPLAGKQLRLKIQLPSHPTSSPTGEIKFQDLDLGQAMEAKLAQAQGSKIYQGLAGGNKVAASANPNTLAAPMAAAAAEASLEQNLIPDQTPEASKHFGQHNLLHFILQNQNMMSNAASPLSGTPVLDLSYLGSTDLNVVIQKIATYLAQHQLAHQDSLAVRVVQDDLGKFVVKAQALANGQVDVAIISMADEFFTQHQEAIRTALQDAGVKLNDLKIVGQDPAEHDLYLAAQDQDGQEQHLSERQQAQEDRARRYRLWQQAYAQEA